MTLEDLKNAQFRPTIFADGAKGMAVQIYRCVDYPRLTVRWMRKDRHDAGTKSYFVDGVEVADLATVVERLNDAQPPV